MLQSLGLPDSRAFDSAFDVQSIDEARLGLANRVTGYETPAELTAIQQADKGLELRRAQAQLNYDYNTAWFDQQQAMRKQKREQRQRLFEMGTIFA